jgi:hypothetical protein
LDAIGFTQLITVQAPLDRVFYADGKFVGGTAPNEVSALMAAGFITAMPDTSGGLYFHFNVVRGSLDGQTAIVPIGARTITARSNEKYWTEGSIQYFAETVNYTLTFESPLAAALQSSGFTDSFRLVLQLDPANGAWALATMPGRSTTFSPQDAQNLTNLLDQYPTSALLEGVQSARSAAFNAIANQILSSGQIMRSKSPQVLLNPGAKLAYYTAPYNLPPNSTFDQARAYCASVSVPGYSGWRIPTQAELYTALTGSDDQMHFTDSPDHQIWGAILGSPQPNTVNASPLLLTDSFFELGRNGITDHWTGPGTSHTFIGFTVHQDGHVSISGAGKWANSTQDMVIAYPDQQVARLICVASLP